MRTQAALGFLWTTSFSIVLAAHPPAGKHLALNRRSATPPTNATTPTISTTFGTIFDVNVTIGNQTFPLTLDTGSSDLWVVKSGFECTNSTDGSELPEASCLYGIATYTPTDTYSEISNQNFGVKYGAGIAQGNMGFEEVTLAGMTIRNQEVGFANKTTPLGDGISCGLVGLAYPALTSAHPGNDTDNATLVYNRLPYTPLLFNMAQQGVIDPFFSIALARTPQNGSSGFGGYLSLGGLPPVNYSSNFSTVPVEVTETLPSNVTSGERVISYWTLTVSGVVYGPGSAVNSNSLPQPNNITTLETVTNSTPFQAFLDSGNFFTYLPDAVVAPINALFSPPAILNPSTGIYAVDCAATAPQFGLTIGNQTFFHDGRDLIFQIGDPSTGQGQCATNLASSEFISPGPGVVLNIIGEPFLKNVLSVYDFGQDQMSFTRLEGEVADESSATTSSGLALKSDQSSMAVRTFTRHGCGLVLWLTSAFIAYTLLF